MARAPHALLCCSLQVNSDVRHPSTHSMGIAKHHDKLGEPSLALAGFQLWVHGRQFPHAEEPYDQDWLNVTAHCGEKGASVWVNGALLQSWHFAQFSAECLRLRESLTGHATLGAAEPELFATLEATDQHGHLEFTVEITPDHLAQEHTFRFSSLDQTYLINVIAECEAILESYPTVLGP